MTLYYATGSLLAEDFLDNRHILMGIESDRLYTLNDLILRENNQQSNFDTLVSMPWFDTFYVDMLEDDSGDKSIIAALLLKEDIFIGRDSDFSLSDEYDFKQITQKNIKAYPEICNSIDLCYNLNKYDVVRYSKAVGTEEGLKIYRQQVGLLSRNDDVQPDTAAGISMNMQAIVPNEDTLDVCVYTILDKKDPAFKCIYAVRIGDVYASLKDIVSLQGTFNILSKALGNAPAGYCAFGKSEDFIICTLRMPRNVKSSCVVSDCSTIPAEVSQTLATDYIELTEQGLSFSRPISESYNSPDEEVPVCPVADGLVLSRIYFYAGDTEAQNKYYVRYDALYPRMSVAVQQQPADSFTRALPDYQKLVKIYDVSKVEVPAIDASKNEQTSFFSNSSLADNQTPDIFSEDSDSDDFDTEDSYDSLNMDITLSKIPLQKVFKYYDCCNMDEALEIFKEANPDIFVDVQDIKGRASNNLMSLQPNETMFFTGLRSLVYEGICIEKEIYTLADLNSALSKGVTSEFVDAFIQDMCKEAYALNWQHTGHASVLTTDTSDTDDDGDASSPIMVLQGRYHVRIDKNTGKLYTEPDMVSTLGASDQVAVDDIPDGWQHISSFIKDNVTNSLGWAETLIRLLRWGYRKPTALSVPTSTSKRLFLDLQSLAVSSFSGDFTRLTPINYSNINGKTASYVLAGTIHSGLNMANLEYIQSATGTSLTDIAGTICGFILHTYTDEGKIKETYIDIFTAARLISKGNLSILGIDFDTETGKFIVSDNSFSVGFKNDISYCPSDNFSILDNSDSNFKLSAIRKCMNDEPQRCVAYECEVLVQVFIVLSAILENNAQKAYPIFDLLDIFNVLLSKDFITEIVDIVFDANTHKMHSTSDINKGLSNFERSRGYTKNQALRILLFSGYVMPLFSVLYSRIKSDFSLADVLNTALAVANDFNPRTMNPVTKDTSNIAELEQFVSNFTEYYCVKNPLSGADIIYFAGASGTNKLGLWLPQDVDRFTESFKNKLAQMTVKEAQYVSFIKAKVSSPYFSNVWRAVFSNRNPNVAALREYQALLKDNFILATDYPDKLDTYHQIVNIVARIAKEGKMRQGR